MPIYRNTGNWNAETQTFTVTSTKEEHVGCVKSVYLRDHQAMSDVYTLATYAKVINPDGSDSEVLVNANFECDVNGDRAEVDATEEALLANACWHEAQELAARERAQMLQRKEAEAEARRPKKGSRVVGTKGKHLGLVGTVAHVSGSQALVKPDDKWQDRATDGAWVRLSSLSIRT